MLFIAHLYKDTRRNYLMRLLILLLAIVIGNARARECKWDTPADYSVTNDVLTFNSNCTSIVKVNDDCSGFPSGVTSVVLPQGVQQVGDGAFIVCSSLTSVTFSQGLQSIDHYAFYGCSIGHVILPQGLQYIGSNAFGGDVSFAFTPSSNPCYDGNYHSDACKNKITAAYNRTAFIDLYNRNYTTCN